MLKLSNIPNEVYYSACEYEKINITIDELNFAKDIYENEINKRHFTDGGLEKAILDYMTLSGNFNEDDGIFAGVNGYIIE